VPVKVTKDRVAEVMKGLRSLASDHVLVGFPGETSNRGEPINNPTLAYIHEHGSPAANIPARPFLTSGVREAEDKIVAVFEAGAKRALDGDAGAGARALNQAGHAAVGAVQNKIATGSFAPLKPATIKRKKSSKPLINTGALKSAVTFVVRTKIGK
jgi:hypothetical protein